MEPFPDADCVGVDVDVFVELTLPVLVFVDVGDFELVIELVDVFVDVWVFDVYGDDVLDLLVVAVLVLVYDIIAVRVLCDDNDCILEGNDDRVKVDVFVEVFDADGESVGSVPASINKRE